MIFILIKKENNLSKDHLIRDRLRSVREFEINTKRTLLFYFNASSHQQTTIEIDSRVEIFVMVTELVLYGFPLHRECNRSESVTSGDE